LSSFHAIAPDRVAVGAGASELVMRAVSAREGPVLVRRPTFVEYGKAAAAFGRELLVARDDDEFLALLPRAATAFLCHPNNPDGRLHPADFLARVGAIASDLGIAAILDLAYAPLCDPIGALPEGLCQLWAPNKAMDCAGVRAGYLVASETTFASRLEALAPSWILSAEGVELLAEFIEPATRAWFDATRPLVQELRRELAALLRERNWDVREGEANFLVAAPPPPRSAADAAHVLRSRDIRVRDAANMGLPGWLRLAARPRAELDLLRSALA
jgi:histidinol-phosphate aminotransferase